MICIDVDYTFNASCSECDGTIKTSDAIYCGKCLEDRRFITDKMKTALVLLPRYICRNCKNEFPSALTVTKIEGVMCLGCAMDFEAELLTSVATA